MLRDDPVLHPWRATPLPVPMPWPEAQAPALVLFVGPAVRPGRELAELLAQSSLRCAAVSDAATAREACGHLQFDALVIDAAVLGPSLALGLAQLQPVAACPLLVAAPAASEVDAIVALEHGASAYLALPLSPRLLRAHLTASLRSRPSTDAAAEAVADSGGLGGWLLDPMLRELRSSGRSVALTEAQFNMLRCLSEQAGRVVPRAELEARVTGPEASLTARSIDVYVHRLRRRLEAAGVLAFDIQCVRGRGYRLRERRPDEALALS
jgi:DNA-binding response OmpR family regulator